jgi:hypothetical protein
VPPSGSDRPRIASRMLDLPRADANPATSGEARSGTVTLDFVRARRARSFPLAKCSPSGIMCRVPNTSLPTSPSLAHNSQHTPNPLRLLLSITGGLPSSTLRHPRCRHSGSDGIDGSAGWNVRATVCSALAVYLLPFLVWISVPHTRAATDPCPRLSFRGDDRPGMPPRHSTTTNSAAPRMRRRRPPPEAWPVWRGLSKRQRRHRLDTLRAWCPLPEIVEAKRTRRGLGLGTGKCRRAALTK